MRAKSVNEGSKQFRDEERYKKAEEIETAVYQTYNGDDVEYEVSEDDQIRLEEALDKYFDTPDEIEELGDVEFIMNNMTTEEIDEIHQTLVEAGFIEGYDDDEDTGVLDQRGNVIKTGDHVDLDDEDEDEMDRVDREYDD